MLCLPCTSELPTPDSASLMHEGSCCDSHAPTLIQANGITIDLRVGAALAPSVLRAFAGRTGLDAEVDALDVPTRPLWLNVCVRALRWYRRSRPTRLGQRCVFDPSCSRYAELAFRRRGLWSGARFVIRRLRACRPGAGGTDLP